MGMLRRYVSDGVLLSVATGVVAASLELIFAYAQCQVCMHDAFVSACLRGQPRPFPWGGWELGGLCIGFSCLVLAVAIIPLVFASLQRKKIAVVGALHLSLSYGVFMGLVIFFQCSHCFCWFGLDRDVVYECTFWSQQIYADACPLVLTLPVLYRELSQKFLPRSLGQQRLSTTN